MPSSPSLPSRPQPAGLPLVEQCTRVSEKLARLDEVVNFFSDMVDRNGHQRDTLLRDLVAALREARMLVQDQLGRLELLLSDQHARYQEDLEDIRNRAILEQNELQARQQRRLDHVFAAAKLSVEEARRRAASDMDAFVERVDTDLQHLDDRSDVLATLRDRMKSCTSEAQNEIRTTLAHYTLRDPESDPGAQPQWSSS
ncbi:hypothetical protein OC835_003307 [Tilletia horrida]|nr:hypothetical protein OC835_003307 [Tilletia horrida]